MWTATVDFTKTFDSISHNSIWESLLSCNVDHGYVCLLKNFIKIRRRQYGQTKRVRISISNKVPQGDPMSNLLFNTVLQYALKQNDAQRWQKRNGNVLERPRTRLPDELAIH